MQRTSVDPLSIAERARPGRKYHKVKVGMLEGQGLRAAGGGSEKFPRTDVDFAAPRID